MGVRVPVGMAVTAFGVGVLVAAGDASSRGPAVEAIGALNYLLVWGVVHQLGFCWRDGLLGGDGPTAPRAPARALAMAAGGAVGYALLVGPGPFPVSLILVTGQEPSNTDPPSAAMLAWSLAQVGTALLVAPVVRRVLERGRVRRAVRVLGAGSMALYLWHMLPVLIVAAAFYLTGLAPEPRYGSAGWWALRVPWLLMLGAVLVGVVRALRPLERGLAAADAWVRPAAGLRGPAAWRLWAGLGVSVWALTYFAGHGFASGGEFPVWPTVGLAVGTACVATLPRRGDGSGEDGAAKDPGASRTRRAQRARRDGGNLEEVG